MIKSWNILLIAFIFSALYSCSDEEPFVVPEQENIFAFHTDEVSLPVKGRYYTLRVSMSKQISASELLVSTDSDWLELQADTVSTDGVIEIFVPVNTGMKSREANVKVSAKDGSESAICVIRQKGMGDNDSNSSVADCFYIGWGYNIFNEYMSSNSVCTPIIDHEKIAVLAQEMPIIQSVLRSREETEHITANTLYEMAELMTRQMTKTETNYKGSKKTVVRFESTGEFETGNESYAYLSLKRIVASSALDLSMLQYLQDKGYDLFTEEFHEAYEQVLQSPKDEELIDGILEKFGTHLIISSELGGIMDLTLNFSRTIKGELNMRAEDFSDYFFKNKASDFASTAGKVQGVNSKISIGETFKILGGLEDARQQIEDNIESDGRIDPQALEAWLRSLDCNSLDNMASLSALLPVNFILVPVWTLFPETATGTFLKKMIDKSQQSNYSCQNYVTGTDYYAFPLKNAPFMDFETGEEQTLVRVVYASINNGKLQPVLEICNEYVPTIRGDKRITVIYGIKNGRAFHGAGLFPGDGEGNPPAFLTFSDGDVYVKPIKEKDAFEKIDTVYYLHGNIYETNLGIKTPVPMKQEMVDQYLTLTDNNILYPIVKIGSGYWSRKNIIERLGFGEAVDPDDPDDYYDGEDIIDGVLYANIFYGNSSAIQFNNPGVFGAETDIDGNRIYWYLPRVSDVRNLETYIGNNCKALFPKQQSGFDAQFLGYCGDHDDLNDGSYFGEYGMHYVQEYCFIVSKETEKMSGEALVLSPDYTLKRCNINKTRDNWYPVRLYRSSYYTYK